MEYLIPYEKKPALDRILSKVPDSVNVSTESVVVRGRKQIKVSVAIKTKVDVILRMDHIDKTVQSFNDINPKDWVDVIGHPKCDICKVVRSRYITYLLNVDGQTIQAGGRCLDNIIGKSLRVALDKLIPFLEESSNGEDDRDGCHHPSTVWAKPSIVFYLSIKEIEINGYQKSDTPSPTGLSVMDRILKGEGEGVTMDGFDEVIQFFASVKMESAFYWNVHALLSSKDEVTGKYFQTIAAAAVVWMNRNTLKDEGCTDGGFLDGEIKERVYFSGVIKKITPVDGYYGASYLHIFQTDDMKTVVWFSTSIPKRDVGDSIVAKATIKAKQRYKGRDQTLVTRVTYK